MIDHNENFRNQVQDMFPLGGAPEKPSCEKERVSETTHSPAPASSNPQDPFMTLPAKENTLDVYQERDKVRESLNNKATKEKNLQSMLEHLL